QDRRLHLRVLVPGLTRLEVGNVHPQLLRDPCERLTGRPGLPSLDLAEVLLREPIAGKLRLGQAGADAELAESRAEPRRSTLSRVFEYQGAAVHRGPSGIGAARLAADRWPEAPRMGDAEI